MSDAELEKLRMEITEIEALLEVVFTANPNGICIGALDGSMEVNEAGLAISGGPPENRGLDALTEQYGLFRPDRVTPFPPSELAITRSLVRGERVVDDLVWMRSGARPGGMWLSVSSSPLPDGTAVAVMRDVTVERFLAESLASRNSALEARDRDNALLVERLRLSLDELGTPVLELWDDVLAVPLVGLLDTQRSAQMSERVLAQVVDARARFVIVDLTGVATVDTSTADRLIKLASSIHLLGAECVVCGIQPAVAQTLVAIGIELHGLTSLHDLDHALAHCLSQATASAA